MKFSKKILATVALSASLFGGASAANAAIHNVGGRHLGPGGELFGYEHLVKLSPPL